MVFLLSMDQFWNLLAFMNMVNSWKKDQPTAESFIDYSFLIASTGLAVADL